MVVGCVGRDAVRLSVHAAALAIGAKVALAVAGIVLVVVGVAVVGMVVARVLLAVGLRLRARSTLLLGGLRLRLLVLALSRRVGRVVSAVLAVRARTTESGLVVGGATLRVLAEAITLLGGVVAAKGSLLRRGAVLLTLRSLLAELLAIVAVRGSVLLVRGVVRGVIARSRGEGATGLLRLRLGSLVAKVVEWRLGSRRVLLAEGIQGLLLGGGGSRILRTALAETTILLAREGRLRDCGNSIVSW